RWSSSAAGAVERSPTNKSAQAFIPKVRGKLSRCLAKRISEPPHHRLFDPRPLNRAAPATPMTRHKAPERPVHRFHSDAPPALRHQSNAQPGYWWNSTTQELIPILPEDHPDYRQNQEIIAAAIRRWNGGTSR